jgi:hypothetical protein
MKTVNTTPVVPFSKRSHYIVTCVDDSFNVDPRYAETRTYILGYQNARFVEVQSWQGVR